MVALLLSKGADIHAKDLLCRDPKELAEKYTKGKIVQMLNDWEYNKK